MIFNLHVRVIEAANIPKMDLSSKTDAYCIVSTSSESRTTKTINDCMLPRWNQEFHFTVTTPTVGSLSIIMKDKNVFKDQYISSLEIQFASLSLGKVIDQWYDMIPYKGVKKGGTIHLLLHMAPIEFQPFVDCQNFQQTDYAVT